MLNFIFFKNLVRARSIDEDLKRREFIFNILLLSSLLLFAIALIVVVAGMLTNDAAAERSPFGLILAIVFIFSALYYLSKAGFFVMSSHIFLAINFFFASYMAYKWGVEVQVALLFYVLIIVMSGVLASTRFAFAMTIISSLILGVINYSQIHNIIKVDFYWKAQNAGAIDVVMFSVIFFIIAIVSWLSNREIEKSLARARKSEAELKKERDFLEVKVEERTKELQEIQAERLAQISRFAEFGRLSSGLFHDLMNPLTAVSLNMEKARSEQSCCEGVDKARPHLERAIEATRKMEEFISAVRRQMSNQESKSYFSLADEVSQIIGILSHKALTSKVKVNFLVSHHIKTYGNAVKFSQVAANLISNAIDACEGAKEKTKEVLVSLAEKNGMIMMVVEDNGKGIPKECINKIFEPFFTTKEIRKGIGLGLSLTKTIIEKDFEGKIRAESVENKGTKFIINFSKKEEHEKLHRRS